MASAHYCFGVLCAFYNDGERPITSFTVGDFYGRRNRIAVPPSRRAA